MRHNSLFTMLARIQGGSVTIRAALITSMLGLALWLPGCFVNICEEPPSEASFGWSQGGVFEAFPPEGQKNGYSISWIRAENDASTVYRKDAKGAIDSAEVRVRASQRESTVAWVQLGDRAVGLTAFEIRQEMNESFATLGLPAPLSAQRGDEPRLYDPRC